MYTGIRASIKLKDTVEAKAIKTEIAKKGYFEWKEIAAFTDNTIIKLWVFEDDNCDSIPSGRVAYMPEYWDKNHSSVIDSDIWNFTCSLKNYNSSIAFFIHNILPIISEDYYIETMYEEAENETIIQKGEIECLMW